MNWIIRLAKFPIGEMMMIGRSDEDMPAGLAVPAVSSTASIYLIFIHLRQQSAWSTEGSKMFFFEKKNQKTFIPTGACCPSEAVEEAKVFCFFSSEKKALLS
jgi:hypothetical protein